MKTKFVFLLMTVTMFVSMSFICVRDGYFLHPRYCNKYIQCLHGLAYEHTCPHGLVYNPATSLCDDVFNMDCGGPKQYIEEIRCVCKDKRIGYKLHCGYGSDFTGVSCVGNSPCYYGVDPDDVCGEPENN